MKLRLTLLAILSSFAMVAQASDITPSCRGIAASKAIANEMKHIALDNLTSTTLSVSSVELTRVSGTGLVGPLMVRYEVIVEVDGAEDRTTRNKVSLMRPRSYGCDYRGDL